MYPPTLVTITNFQVTGLEQIEKRLHPDFLDIENQMPMQHQNPLKQVPRWFQWKKTLSVLDPWNGFQHFVCYIT